MHLALTASIFLIASVVYYLINFEGLEGFYPELTETMRTVVPMGVVIGMSGGFFIRKRKLAEARQARSLEKRISLFQKAHLFEMVFYEFTGLVAVTATFLTGTVDFLIVAIAFVGILLFKFPHKKYISKALGLKPTDSSRLV